MRSLALRMILRKLGCFSLALCFLTGEVHAQERRLSPASIPAPVKGYLETQFSGAARVRYYSEVEEGVRLIEAEFAWKGREYAVTFDADGKLAETEVALPFADIQDGVRTRIAAALESAYSRYKITSVEEVAPGSAASLYEIKVKTRSGVGSPRYYELQFDRAGTLKSTKEISLKPIPSHF